MKKLITKLDKFQESCSVLNIKVDMLKKTYCEIRQNRKKYQESEFEVMKMKEVCFFLFLIIVFVKHVKLFKQEIYTAKKMEETTRKDLYDFCFKLDEHKHYFSYLSDLSDHSDHSGLFDLNDWKSKFMEDINKLSEIINKYINDIEKERVSIVTLRNSVVMKIIGLYEPPSK